MVLSFSYVIYGVCLITINSHVVNSAQLLNNNSRAHSGISFVYVVLHLCYHINIQYIRIHAKAICVFFAETKNITSNE